MPAFRKNSLQRVPRSGPRRSRSGAARSVHPAREVSPSLPSARLYVEIAEAGNGANFGVHEGRVLGCGFLELDEGLREIVFEILGVGRIVEAVDVPIFVQSSDGEGPAGITVDSGSRKPRAQMRRRLNAGAAGGRHDLT